MIILAIFCSLPAIFGPANLTLAQRLDDEEPGNQQHQG